MTAGTVTIKRPLSPFHAVRPGGLERAKFQAKKRKRASNCRDAFIPGTMLSAFGAPKHVLQALDALTGIVRDAKVNFDSWDWSSPTEQQSAIDLTVRYAAMSRANVTDGMLTGRFGLRPHPEVERRFLREQATVRNEWDRASRLAGADNALGRLRHLAAYKGA